jgi:hypothetical protein
MVVMAGMMSRGRREDFGAEVTNGTRRGRVVFQDAMAHADFAPPRRERTAQTRIYAWKRKA